jgi:hypothetical protein
MTIDRARLLAIFDGLGQKLRKPATMCLIGISPSILRGQPDRQSADIDIWRPASAYDDSDLRRACEELGLLFDPKGELAPDAIYLQVVSPGIVKFPDDLREEILGHYGVLTVTMPAPALLSAAKSARGQPRDCRGHCVLWIKERAPQLDDIRAAIDLLPEHSQREAATENMVFVELVVETDRGRK